MTEASHWSGRCAFYAASLLRLGDFIDAGFVAAVLFEKYIEDEMGWHGLQRSVNGDFICNAIDGLARINPSRYPSTKLHEIRKIRNRYVIHADNAFQSFNDPEEKEHLKREISKLVHFVWQNMDPVSYHRYLTQDRIPLLQADYALMAVREYFQNDEIEISPFESQIHEDDFEDLMHMRKHFLQLTGFLNQGLLQDYPNLELDIISSVDETSGYVWMAANLKRETDDHLRDRVRQASASLVATPLDVRIGIEFGGEAHGFRDDYYSFLKTQEFRDFIGRNDGLHLFDVDWYSSIIRSVPAGDHISSDDFQLAVRDARLRLRNYTESRRIISWDRLLTGYVISRQTLSYDSIVEKLRVIIEMYYRFERYRRDFLRREAPLAWLPANI